VNTANRVLWIVVGLLLLAAGVVGALASQGRLPGVDRGSTLLTPAAGERWRDWGGWAPAASIAAALLLASLGFLLLRAQLRGHAGPDMPDVLLPPRPSGDEAQAPGGAGRTLVTTPALNRALTRDLQTHRRVRRAAVHLTGKPRRPALLVRLAVAPDADIPELRAYVDQSLGRLTSTSGVHPHLDEVVVSMATQEPARVT
jgi:hypothetical protein